PAADTRGQPAAGGARLDPAPGGALHGPGPGPQQEGHPDREGQEDADRTAGPRLRPAGVGRGEEQQEGPVVRLRPELNSVDAASNIFSTLRRNTSVYKTTSGITNRAQCRTSNGGPILRVAGPGRIPTQGNYAPPFDVRHCPHPQP